MEIVKDRTTNVCTVQYGHAMCLSSTQIKSVSLELVIDSTTVIDFVVILPNGTYLNFNLYRIVKQTVAYITYTEL